VSFPSAALDVEIAAQDLDALKRFSFEDYGEAGVFPVFDGGKRRVRHRRERREPGAASRELGAGRACGGPP